MILIAHFHANFFPILDCEIGKSKLEQGKVQFRSNFKTRMHLAIIREEEIAVPHHGTWGTVFSPELRQSSAEFGQCGDPVAMLGVCGRFRPPAASSTCFLFGSAFVSPSLWDVPPAPFPHCLHPAVDKAASIRASVPVCACTGVR